MTVEELYIYYKGTSTSVCFLSATCPHVFKPVPWVLTVNHCPSRLTRFDSLDLRDVRRLLDDATGEAGLGGAARPQGGGGPRGACPADDSGSRCSAGLSRAALPRGSVRQHNPGLVVRCLSLTVGQTGQSHCGMDLPPALVAWSLLLPVKCVEENTAVE